MMKLNWAAKIDFKISSLFLIGRLLLIFQIKESYCNDAYLADVNNELASRLHLKNSFETVNSECPLLVTVRIRWNGKFIHYCAGSMITDKSLITAARCVQWSNRTDIGIDDIQIAAKGTPYKPNELRFAYPVKITKHPGFLFDDTYDLALIELDKPLTYGKSNRVELNEVIIHGKTCFVCGYGATEEGGKYPVNLRAAWVKVYEHFCPVFGKLGLETTEIYENLLCSDNSGYHGSGGCAGDIGNPLYCDGRLSGLMTAQREGNPDCGPTNYFVSIRNFYTWIVHKI